MKLFVVFTFLNFNVKTQYFFHSVNIIFSQDAILIFNEPNVQSNDDILKLKIRVFNDFVQSTIVDASMILLKNITKVNMYLTMTHAKDPKHKVKAVFDLKKVLNGIYSNPIIRSFMENFYKSIDFEAKFPFKPVRKL